MTKVFTLWNLDSYMKGGSACKTLPLPGGYCDEGNFSKGKISMKLTINNVPHSYCTFHSYYLPTSSEYLYFVFETIWVK